MRSIFGPSLFRSTHGEFHRPEPSSTARTIHIEGPDSNEARPSSRQGPIITELRVAGEDHESEKDQWLFPSSQPDLVQEPEEPEVVDLVDSEHETEHPQEEVPVATVSGRQKRHLHSGRKQGQEERQDNKLEKAFESKSRA